jgi:RNA polymerase sigma factor (sigma-70 family)
MAQHRARADRARRASVAGALLCGGSRARFAHRRRGPTLTVATLDDPKDERSSDPQACEPEAPSSARAPPARDAAAVEPLTLSELARRARAGDRGALEQFAIAARRFLVLALRTRMTKELQRDCDVEDLAQHAWTSVQRNLERLRIRGDRSLVGWLRRVALTRLLDANKSLARRARLVDRSASVDELLEHEDEPLPGALRSREDPVEEFLQRLDSDRVLGGLGRLPPDLAEILWLVDFDGCSMPQAGRRAGIAEHVARRRYLGARARLARELGESP